MGLILRRMMLKGALLGLPCAMMAPSMVRAESFYPDVLPRQLVLPQDHGSHPLFRTEWWYLTGWLGEGESAMGFQLTFFRSRTRHNPKNPSRFAPTQLLFAHGAVSDTAHASLRHAERSGRLGRAALHAAEGDTDLRFEDWRLRRLERAGRSVYEGRFAGEGFSVEFEATAGQPPILRGVDGFSSKGPRPEHASHYYSQAPLTVRAKVGLGQSSQLRSGLAWLDHEWSSQLLMPGGVGWDWIGINLIDGGTLMAFRIRGDEGQTLYRHADARGADGRSQSGWQALAWQPTGQWRSPRSLIQYPLPMALQLGQRRLELTPLMLPQEVDARASTGGFYWEGAVELREQGRLLGRGFLELTGYGGALQL